MAITITLPEGWAWTAAALFSTQLLLAVQMTLVNKHRKLAGIAYPQMYAEKSEAATSRAAYVFNCAQRAHQNTLENITVVFMGTAMTALYHPYVAAASCGLWVFGRALYTRGYIQKPDLRNSRGGYIGSVGQAALLLGSAVSTFNLVVAELGF